MKKFILCLVLGLLLSFNCAYCKNEIAFIYINGSNNNDEKMKKWFFDGIAKFHPILKNSLEKDPFMVTDIMDMGDFSIKQTPNTLFWGDMSKNQLSELKADLNVMDVLSPKLAQLVRRAFALTIHDAIWVSKFQNMYPIVEMLHQEVMKEYEKGNTTILMGYSAGTFVTYEYYLTKLAFLKQSDFLEIVSSNPQNVKYLNEHPIENTCVDAIFQSNLVNHNIIGGMVSNDNFEIFKKGITNLPATTKKYCAPKNSIKGVINYASPIVLFYSDLSDPNFAMSKVMTALAEYMVENDFFWLTVNYANDPMGFPTTRNLTATELEGVLGKELSPKLGFFYDKSDVNSSRNLFMAHTSYWSTSKRFAKLIIEAYKEGRVNFLVK